MRVSVWPTSMSLAVVAHERDKRPEPCDAVVEREGGHRHLEDGRCPPI